ncbi:DUF2799 domain-containing protein [Parvularcula sp. LCG005]|uniref:DUF2799 domain-containing protein n=1 Tax=Parvularcula sp. LCG005 TaxID=3078805 RepID=UPI002942B2A1|nr:DUF2799 domain-containing protein [Parvularcula sp. LCG005]WOI54392.1 DUF2799 domain-containing protein [Parvularcula sp. LCG005]
MRRALMISLVGVSLTACASRLSQEDCEIGDWSTIGYQDGVDGLPAGKVQDRVKECSRFDIALDQRTYEAGRQSGLEVFCSPEGALDAGYRRVGEINLCPAEAGLARLAYGVGRDYADARANLNRIEDSYRYERQAISGLRSQIRRLRYRLRDARSKEERSEIFADLRYARNRLDRAIDSFYYYRSLLPRARFDYDRAEDAYYTLRSDLTGMAQDQLRQDMLSSRYDDDASTPPPVGGDDEEWSSDWDDDSWNEEQMRRELREELNDEPGEAEPETDFPDIMQPDSAQ